MSTTSNSPCTVTRVIERTAERIAAVAKTLYAKANVGETSQPPLPVAEIEDLRREAAELKQCAYQLTGRAY